MTKISVQHSKITETACLLARQQEVCISLSMLLSYLVDTLAGDVERIHFTALSGSVTILDNISKELQIAYNQIEELSDIA